MRYCDGIEIEDGWLLREWPTSITVQRELLDAPPGPHVRFGRRGVLRFEGKNGYAVYQRQQEHFGGWIYRLIESEHRRV